MTGVIAVVGAEELTVKSQPDGAVLLGRRRLSAWLGDQPQRFTTGEVAAVYDAARRSSTWR